jgi:putative aldouronate transport system substrate-binding protein
MFFAGCAKDSDNPTEPTTTEKITEAPKEVAEETEASMTDEFVNLKWYVRHDPQNDADLVHEAMNEYIKEKINAEVDIIPIDTGAFNDKMKLILSSGEEFDITFVGPSYADYFGNAAKGAFLPLDDLLPTYAPKAYAQIPEKYWGAVKINGQIMAVPNYQIFGRGVAFYAQSEFTEKYNFDLSACNTLEDLEPFLAQIKAGNPELVPFGSYREPQYFTDCFPELGIDEIGTRHSVGTFEVGDESLTVINQYEKKEFVDRLNLIRKWYELGYINRDAATLNMWDELKKSGKIVVQYANYKPGAEAEQEIQFGDRDLDVKVNGTPFANTWSVAATLTAISATSKNPERAMMFVELMNTDKDLYNMMCFGIEGTHYTKVSENRIEYVENSGYKPGKAWSFGNNFNSYVYDSLADDVWEQTIAVNESAEQSVALGFVFDQEPVKTEMAQCSTVINEYLPGLMTGSVDPSVYLPEFLAKLEAAGGNEIIAEKQRQADEWKATNLK